MFRNPLKLWGDKKGTAVVEAAMLLPVMMVMLFGMWDLGNGILYNQHTITASQVVGDLITRDKEVTTTTLDNYIEAGRLAYGNNNTDSYGIDIVSIEFGANGNPSILWRETRNMTPNPDVLTKVRGLGTEGEGVIAVTVSYTYEPMFTHMFTSQMVMKEEAYLRGRRSNTVRRT